MLDDLNAIRTYFLANLANLGLTRAQVIIDNEPAKKIDETRLWVRFNIRPGQNRIRGLGDKIMVDQIGQIILQVFVPRGSGSTAAYDPAHKFAELYRGWKSSDGKGGVVRAYSTGYQAVVKQDDPFYQVNATVYYESNRKRPAKS